MPNKERKILAAKFTEFFDFYPLNWLKPFQKNNFVYLLKMGLFYHFLGFGLMILGTDFIINIIPEYETPQIPVSISLAISAGIFEESVFFGIPFYLSGNPLIILGSGIIWSIAHLFNSGVISIQSLAYGGFFFSILHIFFSLRVWISGKGWFAIIFHSGWNLTILILYCGLGFLQCNALNDYFDLINILMAGASISIVYLVYFNTIKKNHLNRFILLIPAGILVFGLIVLFGKEFNLIL